MNRTAIQLGALVCLLCACRDAEHRPGDDGEGHGHGDGAVAFTGWGQKSEVFAEYAPLVVGAPSDTAIHVTRLADFTALLHGSLTVQLVQADGSTVTASADTPARPGIFTPIIAPTSAGPCRLTFAIRTPDWSEAITADQCTVHETAPPAAHPDETGIKFLKEQQWNIEFATAVVAERPMRKTVRVSAEIKPITGREAHLTAALGGRVQFTDEAPIIGRAVEKGELLAQIIPPLVGATNRAALQADVVGARAETEDARAERDRIGRLAADDAVADRRVRESQTRLAVAESRLQAAQERLREYDITASGKTGSSNAFRVRSPIAGTLVAVAVTSGETVASGAHLFTVIDLRRVWIEGRVFEPDIPAILDAREASFSIDGHERRVVSTDEHGDETGRLVAVGQVLDPTSRTVPIVFEIANDNQLLRIGQFAELEVASGEPNIALAVPTSAVLTESARPVLFVHVAGETFERRFVRTGLRASGWVQVLAGLSAGERVVIRGAHTVKLAASTSTVPAHGHAH